MLNLLAQISPGGSIHIRNASDEGIR